VVRTEDRSVGRHVVQFYDHDEELAERVAGYLLGALEGDGVAIVIATEYHRREFESRLEQAGADLTAARDSGTYLAIDVRRMHHEVVGASPPGVSGSGVHGAVRTFALSRDAPAAARHFAVGALRRLGIDDLADDVALVVTELAANAVRHANSGFTVVLSSRPDVVRISVRDASPLPPAGVSGSSSVLPVAPLHGLGAVNAMASRWGVESLGSDRVGGAA
jgi:hypothetical protein